MNDTARRFKPKRLLGTYYDITRHYWVCQHCREKFSSKQEVRRHQKEEHAY